MDINCNILISASWKYKFRFQWITIGDNVFCVSLLIPSTIFDILNNTRNLKWCLRFNLHDYKFELLKIKIVKLNSL